MEFKTDFIKFFPRITNRFYKPLEIPISFLRCFSIASKFNTSALPIPNILCQTSRMKRLVATTCLTIAVLFGSAGVSCSADFQKGLAAYDSGDYATALREWEPLAEQGDTSAQINLGRMYAKGIGVPKNYKAAVKWYRLAAKQGDADAQFNLGLMLRRGQGVPKDYKAAVKWYRLAAKQGDASAHHNLGLMYVKGLGVSRDYVYAHMWWNIAASSVSKVAVKNSAIKNRDVVAKKMTPSQLEKAQDLARECVRKKYKGC